jgi:hypothetical protein
LRGRGWLRLRWVRLGKGSVRTRNLHNQAVTERKIVDGAVTESKLGHQAVSHSKLAPGGVQSSNFAASGYNSWPISPPPNLAAGACEDVLFEAQGVQPGDVIAYSVGIPDTIPLMYGPVSVSPATTVGRSTAQDGQLNMSVCNHTSSTEAIDGVRLNWVAIRRD